MGRAYLSLGSNVEPERWLGAAVAELRRRFGVLDVSPVYRSAAVGFDGPDFLNLAVALDSDPARRRSTRGCMRSRIGTAAFAAARVSPTGHWTWTSCSTTT